MYKMYIINLQLRKSRLKFKVLACVVKIKLMKTFNKVVMFKKKCKTLNNATFFKL